MSRDRHARRCRRDRGAAVVEFAIVLPVLLALLFGIVDYGLWFNNSLSVRQGVREAARKAVVQGDFPGCGSVTVSGMDAVACGAKAMSVTSGGTAYAKVYTASASSGAPVSTWVRGDLVVVCVTVKATSFTGFVPLPSGGYVRSMTVMSIEDDATSPSPLSHASEADPSGAGWSWCRPS